MQNEILITVTCIIFPGYTFLYIWL
uniref:Uncharacterized protein n=1 Tax=Pyricularia oryzae (strain P131) TaxID=1143193 RepID=L7J7L0_PYRO1